MKFMSTNTDKDMHAAKSYQRRGAGESTHEVLSDNAFSPTGCHYSGCLPVRRVCSNRLPPRKCSNSDSVAVLPLRSQFRPSHVSSHEDPSLLLVRRDQIYREALQKSQHKQGHSSRAHPSSTCLQQTCRRSSGAPY